MNQGDCRETLAACRRELLAARLALADTGVALHRAVAQEEATLRETGRARTASRLRIAELERSLLEHERAETVLHATVEQLQHELATVQSSSVWRATAAVRDRVPPPLRRTLIRAARLLWWSATLQLPHRLRERRLWLEPVQPVAEPMLRIEEDEPRPPEPPRSPDDAALLDSFLFDSAWYLERYKDVAATKMDPLRHYLEHGHKEGRYPNEMFDGAWYLRENDDVAAAGFNPLQHFAFYGGFEGRDPHPDFSIKWYLQNLAEPLPAGLNPLSHYLRNGRQGDKRRLSSPVWRYRERIGRERMRDAVERPELLQHIAIMTDRPAFVVLIDGQHDATTRSIEQQLYPAQSCLGTKPDAIDALTGLDPADTFLVSLQPGEILSEQALYAFAAALNADPALDVIYVDEDRIDGQGRRDPFFKPAWSPDLLEALDYVSAAVCVRASLALPALAAAASRYDFALRVTECTSAIHHIRQILCHRPAGAADPVDTAQIEADIAALHGRLQRTGRIGAVTPVIAGHPAYRIEIARPDDPLVSIVIPTAGLVVDIDGRPVDLIVNCIDTILARSSYRNLEFIVVDNGDFDRTRLDHVITVPLRFVTFTDTVFNVAKKLNLGAELAAGPVILLLNDDIEPISAGWIEAMLALLQKPHVGVVGAKLFYTDMTIQHQGVVLNAGNVDHVRRWVPSDDIGYFFSSRTPRNYLAVTGACMMSRTEHYRAVGGYTEALGVSYNDIDYCLKLRERGYTAVMAPEAELVHFESKSRVAGLDEDEKLWFQTRWSAIATDPFYNEDELTVAPSSFEVQHNARVL